MLKIFLAGLGPQISACFAQVKGLFSLTTTPPRMPMDPPCQWPPLLERRNMAPLANGPLLLKEETCPPPSDFFTKSHTNCPFLPSFLSVTLCVSCLILHLALLSQNLTIAVPQSR